MILEVDCGNSFLKWRLLTGSACQVAASGVAQGQAELLAQLGAAGNSVIEKTRIVSVRSEVETTSLIEALQLKCSTQVALAQSERILVGVRNGYEDHKLLGTDRWLAIVAAFALSKSACLVLDIGTAVTADFVDADGNHLGGFICPGIKLMREQLFSSTARISCQFPARIEGHGPGRSTVEAVERGIELMLLGFIDSQVKMANDFWGKTFSLIVTGGDAAVVKLHFSEALIVPDLVFRGLALACPD